MKEKKIKKGKKNILLGISGSIAAYKACELVREFRRAGYFVRVVMTKDAHHFVTALTLQSLAGSQVVEDFFSLPGRERPVHIELAEEADLILIAPASADIIGKIAHGLADDVLACTIMASEAPLVIAPAMNDKMYFNKFMQENLQRLEEVGAKIVAPIRGHLACGSVGAGHLAEIQDIVKAVTSCFSSKK